MFTLRTPADRKIQHLMFVTDDSEAGAGADADGTDESTDDAAEEEDKDWRAEFEAQQRINRSLERKGKQDLKRIDALAAKIAGIPDTTTDAPDLEKIRAEVTAEVTAKTNKQIVAARAEALLAGRGLAVKPSTALRLLDLSEVEVDSDGNVDTEALADLVDDLIKNEPSLAAAQGQQQRFQGGADQGARNAAQKSEEQQLTEALGAAQKAHNMPRVIEIKQRLAAIAREK